MTSLADANAHKLNKSLPNYVVFDNTKERPAILQSPAQTISFPLSAEDKEAVRILTAKFDVESNCAGLAAPQIGIPKRIIIFAAPDNPELKKWRPDFTDTMPKTVWINPTYKGIEEFAKHEDYEGCFSVKDIAGTISRYKCIEYSAYTPKSILVQGTANGFLARIIQHEIDHVNGILFIDKARPESLFSIEEYRHKRQEALKDK